MAWLSDFFHLSREVWIAAGIGVIVGMVFLSLLMRAARRRHVTLASSPATELISFQLARIADALERVSLDGVHITREARQSAHRTQASREEGSTARETQASEERPLTRHVSMSMFGR